MSQSQQYGGIAGFATVYAFSSTEAQESSNSMIAMFEVTLVVLIDTSASILSYVSELYIPQ